jgi:hypothetical protein
MYGVFVKDGARTYIAYNPTNLALTVTFASADTGAPLKQINVAAHALATNSDGGLMAVVDSISPYADDPLRLYFRGAGRLLPAPGSFLLSGGDASFPLDASTLAQTVESVPERPDKADSTPIKPPDDQGLIKSWTGRFSGSLLPEGNDMTRFAIYTNQALKPGWQQDQQGAATVIAVRIIYDFDSDGTPDRMETLQNVPMYFGNSFLYQSKITEYYFDGVYGDSRGQIPLFLGDDRGSYKDAFPSTVSNGTVTVQVWGGSTAAPQLPVQISEDASPLLNRASWVRPPFRPTLDRLSQDGGERER